ncbi:9900_t:CDS:2 [Gigaspora rosea]|nr:9900_t:CDS:2 [Gigaspora rosea]
MDISLPQNVITYHSYIDGVILACDISDTNEIKELSRLSREYSSHATYKIPIIMFFSNRWKKNEDELLNEVKTLVGEEFLFDAISINEWTNGFNKFLKECAFRFLGFRDELTPSNDQIKSIMKYATRLYSFEIPMETIIMVRKFEIPENLKKILEKAINDVKESPETLKKAKLDQQLKDLEKVSNIEDFNMSNLAFNILSSLANLKTKIVLFVEKANYLNLESIFLNEIDSITSKIDKYLKFLPEWNDYCIKIINQFEDLNNFVKNIEDSFFYFEIQENLLAKRDKIIEELFNKSKKIDEYKTKKKYSFRQKIYEEKIKQDEDAVYLNFLFTIGLKLVYDLIDELKCIAKKLKLLNSTSIQKILVDLIEIYKKSELCLKDCCLDYIVENLSKIACLINNFCKQIVVDKRL